MMKMTDYFIISTEIMKIIDFINFLSQYAEYIFIDTYCNENFKGIKVSTLCIKFEKFDM